MKEEILAAIADDALDVNQEAYNLNWSTCGKENKCV